MNKKIYFENKDSYLLVSMKDDRYLFNKLNKKDMELIIKNYDCTSLCSTNDFIKNSNTILTKFSEKNCFELTNPDVILKIDDKIDTIYNDKNTSGISLDSNDIIKEWVKEIAKEESLQSNFNKLKKIVKKHNIDGEVKQKSFENLNEMFAMVGNNLTYNKVKALDDVTNAVKTTAINLNTKLDTSVIDLSNNVLNILVNTKTNNYFDSSDYVRICNDYVDMFARTCFKNEQKEIDVVLKNNLGDDYQNAKIILPSIDDEFRNKKEILIKHLSAEFDEKEASVRNKLDSNQFDYYIDNITDKKEKMAEELKHPTRDEIAIFNGYNDLLGELHYVKYFQAKIKDFSTTNADELNHSTTFSIDRSFDRAFKKLNLSDSDSRKIFFHKLANSETNFNDPEGQIYRLLIVDNKDVTPLFKDVMEWNNLGFTIREGAKPYLKTIKSKEKIYYRINEFDEAVIFSDADLEKASARRYYDDLCKLGIMASKTQKKTLYANTVYSIDDAVPHSNKAYKLKDEMINNLSKINGENENNYLLNKLQYIVKSLDLKWKETDGNKEEAYNTKNQTVYIDKTKPIDEQISSAYKQLGDYMLHRHQDINPEGYQTLRDKYHPYALTKEDVDLQNDVFTTLLAESTNISDDVERCVKSTETNNEGQKDRSEMYSTSSNVIKSHIMIVAGAVAVMNYTLHKPMAQILESDIDLIKKFVPDRYTFDSVTLKPEITLQTEIVQEQNQELREKMYKENKLKEQKQISAQAQRVRGMQQAK